MTTTSFHVGKMDCSAEEQLVRIRLGSVAGVGRVDVDLIGRTVTVEHDNDVAAVRTALDSLDLDCSLLDGHDRLDPIPSRDTRLERRALAVALGINAVFFIGELIAGVLARSFGLIADSLDMGADASVYALSLVAVGRSALVKSRLAAASGYLQLGLAFTGLVAVGRRFVIDAAPPDVTTMIVMSVLALIGNVVTILLLHRVRTSEAHIQASWIFTANDIKVNLLVIVAAIAVAVSGSAGPDLIAGAVIFVIVANGARRILRISRQQPNPSR